MKYAILGMMIVLAMVPAALADCPENLTGIVGTVYEGGDINSPVVPDVQVDVTCNTYTQSDVTSSQGVYAVEFYDNTCPLGSVVEACVGDTCASGVVEMCLTDEFNILNVNIFGVPEFGVIAGLTAVTGAGLGFLFLRKRR